MKSKILLIITCFIIIFITACSNSLIEEQSKNENNLSIYEQEKVNTKNTNMGFILYYPDKKNEKMITEIRSVLLEDGQDIYECIIDELLKGPYDIEKFNNIFDNNIELKTIKKYEDIIEINFSSNFINQEDENNQIIRIISVVNTLTELPDIKYVKILVDGQELKNSNDQPYGLLERFDNDIQTVIIEQQNVEQQDIYSKKVVLYFKDQYSNFVIPEVRETEIKGDSIEKSVINELIKGPQKSGLIRTIPEGTQLLKINVSEGTASVTFSEEISQNFKGGSSNEECLISSIVNTLTEFSYINDVKINVEYKSNGDNIDSIGGHFLLDKSIERMESNIGKRIKLYFTDKNSQNLITEYRAIEVGTKSVAKRSIQELINGPRNENLLSTIPEGTKLLSVFIKDEVCYVDFSDEIVNNHSGGSTGEAMTIYSIVNTLTQFDSINKVQIMIEGDTKETLAGHIAIDKPISPNAELIKEQEKQGVNS